MKTYLPVSAALAVLVVCASPSIAAPPVLPSLVGGVATSAFDRGERAILNQDPVVSMMLIHDDDPRFGYQCTMSGSGYTRIRDWSSPMRINTDNGWGGCLFSIGITDPKNVLHDPKIFIDFEGAPANGPWCGNPGRQRIPVTNVQDTRTQPVRMNTDSTTANFCKLTFDVQSPNVEVNIKFWADDEGVEQCINRLPATAQASPPGAFQTASLGHPVTLGIATDNRYGGCGLSIQLVPK